MYYKQSYFISQQKWYCVRASQHRLAMQLSPFFQPSVSLAEFVNFVFELHAQFLDSTLVSS